jgi:hypothetical protein
MDRTTKILLAAIALGLWANAAASLSGPATAQVSPQGTPRQQTHEADLTDIQRELFDINLNLTNIQLGLVGLEEGHCRNRKLCGP